MTEHSDAEEQLKQYYNQQVAKGKDPLAAIQRRKELQTFREQYNVEKTSSPLVCPACSRAMNIHKLYRRLDNPSVFVCKGCLLEFKLDCLTVPLNKLLETLKQKKTATEAKEVT